MLWVMAAATPTQSTARPQHIGPALDCRSGCTTYASTAYGHEQSTKRVCCRHRFLIFFLMASVGSRSAHRKDFLCEDLALHSNRAIDSIFDLD